MIRQVITFTSRKPEKLFSTDPWHLARFMSQSAITFEKLQKVQNRVSTDEDLKMTDLFRYYQREFQAAKALLYRYCHMARI